MTNGCWPTVVILGAPVALARSLAHGLHAAWSRRTDRREDESWPCLAPEPGQAWPADALVYLLGLDWRDTANAGAGGAAVLHQQWRTELQARAQPFVVLYGRPANQWAQLAESLKTIAGAAQWDWLGTEIPLQSGRRGRGCDECGDPACEQRLFSALL